MNQNFVSSEELAKSAYAGCFVQYGHPHTAKIDEAWEWIGEEQRKMWRLVAQSVVNKLNETARKAA